MNEHSISTPISFALTLQISMIGMIPFLACCLILFCLHNNVHMQWYQASSDFEKYGLNDTFRNYVLCRI